MKHSKVRSRKYAKGINFRALLASIAIAAISIAGLISFILSYEKPADNQHEAVLTSVPVILVEPIGVSKNQKELQKPFTESVISGLSDFRGINVLSGNNSFFISNSNLSDKQIAEKFNVDYIVRGMIQTYGDKSRMNISLADLEQNKVIWSDQIDFNFEEIFELQDRVNDSILSQLQVEAVAGDIVNDLREYAQNFEFLTLYLNWSTELQKWNPESHARAETFLSLSLIHI